MKVKTLALLAGAGGSLLIASQANAGFTGLSATVTTVDSSGWSGSPAATVDVIRIFAEFDGLDASDAVQAVAGVPGEDINWTAEGGGTFWQFGFGSDTAATAFAAGFPSGANDTFVTIGTLVEGAPGEVTLTPGWPGFGASALVVSEGAWATTPLTGLGLTSVQGNSILLGQFTLVGGSGLLLRSGVVQGSSNGGAFQYSIAGNESDDGGLNGGVGLFIPTGGGVPAPGALALLGMAGLVGGRRRRRS